VLTRIHVNQHNIRANAAKKGNLPVLTVKDYRRNRKGDTARILHDGEEIARVVYRPDKPLACGAKCWIETSQEVIVD
jgi:hypothetical protein